MMLAFLFIFGGGAFGYYIWVGTVDLTQQPHVESTGGSTTATAQKIAPTLTLKTEERTPGGLFIIATVTNTSSNRMTLPDIMVIEPLYTVSLKYAFTKSEELRELPRVAAMQTRVTVADVSPPLPYNSMRDVEVTLLSGRAHSVAIPLGTWYVMKPGHYEVKVVFRPTDIVLAPDSDAKSLPSFNAGPASTTLAFDWPLPVEKPEKSDKPAPANSGAKAPDTAVKTVELPASK